MAGKFSLNSFFGIDDDSEQQDDQYYEDTGTTDSTPAPGRSQKVVSINSGRQSNDYGKISLFEPRLYSDVKEIATQLLNERAIIVNFTQMENGEAKRVVDFLNGTVFAIDGSIERVGDQIFLCTPHNYEISGNLSANLTKEQDNF